MTRGAEKHLLKQFSGGSLEAFATLVERKRKTVRRFLAAGIGPDADADAWELETFSRAYLELGKLDPEEEDLTVHLLDILRDLAFQKLPDSSYRQTLFATGRDIFATPPDLPPLPKAVLSGEEPADLAPWRAALGDRQLLMLELVFLEAAPVEGVAELINCSEYILQAFLFHLLDSMGELSVLPHQEGCPPDLVLGMQVVRARGHKQRVTRLKEENSRCAGCKELLDRSHAMVTLWTRDWRSEPEGTAALLGRIAPGVARPAAPESKPQPSMITVPFSPPPVKARRSPVPLVMLGLLLVAFVGASVHFLDRPAGAAVETGGAPRSPGRPGPDHKLPDKIGTLSSASAAAEPLFEGTDVATDLRNPATLAYDAGAHVELSPGGAGRAGANRFAIVNGTARIEVPADSKTPFTLVSGDLSVTTKGGVLTTLRTPGRRTLLAVERGSATVKLADGRSVALEPGRQAAIDLATGRSTISDYSPADFSSLAGSDTAATVPLPAPHDQGGSGGGTGTTPVTPRGPGQGGSGVKPADVRGFRDSF